MATGSYDGSEPPARALSDGSEAFGAGMTCKLRCGNNNAIITDQWSRGDLVSSDRSGQSAYRIGRGYDIERSQTAQLTTLICWLDAHQRS